MNIFLGSEITQPAPNAAAFHIIPVPFEHSVSYGGGTAKGPAAIISASQQLELYDGEGIPAKGGIYTQEAVRCDVAREDVFNEIGERTLYALSSGAVPVLLGGEHAVSFPAVQAVQQHLRSSEPRANIGIVQIDAHSDLRDRYEDDPHSHATVMRRVFDLGVPMLQLGVRAISPEELSLRAQNPDRIRYIDARSLLRPTGQAAHQSIAERILPLLESLPEHLYLTIDADGLDPALIPATGTPEPGGLGWYDVLEIIDAVAARRRIVAADLVELAPIAGLHASEFICARLVYQLMGAIARRAVSHSGVV
ncbi:MAG: agmatinase [Spirochaetaceae bacterium]|nr:MAG: agmatinase [Spirochaetaceae bacterium]